MVRETLQRAFLRLLGVRFSADNLRVTIPRKRAHWRDEIIKDIEASAWRANKEVQVTTEGDVTRIVGPEATIEVRIV